MSNGNGLIMVPVQEEFRHSHSRDLRFAIQLCPNDGGWHEPVMNPRQCRNRPEGRLKHHGMHRPVQCHLDRNRTAQGPTEEDDVLRTHAARHDGAEASSKSLAEELARGVRPYLMTKLTIELSRQPSALSESLKLIKFTFYGVV